MDIIFLGNHTVGVIVLKELLKSSCVRAVFAYPDHQEDGVIYDSVKDFARLNNVDVYQPIGVAESEWQDVFSGLAADMIVVADYKYLVSNKLLACTRLGGINFHPSLLPLYRGRAPVNWAIINGERSVGLTVHQMTDLVDAGDILYQCEIPVGAEDTIKDVHEKYFLAYKKAASHVVKTFEAGKMRPVSQPTGSYPVYPARVAEDGLIQWSCSAYQIYNLIRAVTAPYPGAFTYLSKQKYMIWSARMKEQKKPSSGIPGEILDVEKTQILVLTGDGELSITNISYPDRSPISDFRHIFKSGKNFRSWME